MEPAPHTLTLKLNTGQIVAVTLSEPAEIKLLALIAAQHLSAMAIKDVSARTYHLGAKPSEGRGYDDRLTIRTGLGSTKLRELLVLGPVKGGLRHRRAGDKYIVSEAAVREWFGDK